MDGVLMPDKLAARSRSTSKTEDLCLKLSEWFDTDQHCRHVFVKFLKNVINSAYSRPWPRLRENLGHEFKTHASRIKMYLEK